MLRSVVKATFHFCIWERAVDSCLSTLQQELPPLSPKLSALVVVNPGTPAPLSLPWSDIAIATLAWGEGEAEKASLLQLPAPLLDYQSETLQGFVDWNKPWHTSSVWSFLWELYWALSNLLEEGGIRLYMNLGGSGGGAGKNIHMCA